MSLSNALHSRGSHGKLRGARSGQARNSYQNKTPLQTHLISKKAALLSAPTLQMRPSGEWREAKASPQQSSSLYTSFYWTRLSESFCTAGGLLQSQVKISAFRGWINVVLWLTPFTPCFEPSEPQLERDVRLFATIDRRLGGDRFYEGSSSSSTEVMEGRKC